MVQLRTKQADLADRPSASDAVSPTAESALGRGRTLGAKTSSRNVPWIVGGLFLILASIVGVTLLVGALSPQRTVLIASRDLDAGERIGSGDVVEKRLSIGDDIATLTVSRADFGEASTQQKYVTSAKVEKGTVLTASHLVPLDAPPEDFTLIGLVLEPGAYPRSDLQAGNVVHVLRVSGSGQGQLASRVTEARIDNVEDTGNNLFVTVEVADHVAPRVADLASRGQVRLAIPEGG